MGVQRSAFIPKLANTSDALPTRPCPTPSHSQRPPESSPGLGNCSRTGMSPENKRSLRRSERPRRSGSTDIAHRRCTGRCPRNGSRVEIHPPPRRGPRHRSRSPDLREKLRRTQEAPQADYRLWVPAGHFRCRPPRREAIGAKSFAWVQPRRVLTMPDVPISVPSNCPECNIKCSSLVDDIHYTRGTPDPRLPRPQRSSRSDPRKCPRTIAPASRSH